MLSLPHRLTTILLVAAWLAAADGAQSLAASSSRLPWSAASASTLPERLDVRPSELESRLFADAEDGLFDRHSLAEAGLVSSGVTHGGDLARQMGAFASHVERLRSATSATASQQQLAREVLEYLHGQILTGPYRMECSDVKAALESGCFNCVSASLLYSALGREVGLDVAAVAVPGHAFNTVRLPQGELDVQSTCAKWFELQGDSARREQWLRSHGGRGATSTSRRQLSDVALVAIIYYNRGVTDLRRSAFPEAVTQNIKALRLDPACRTAYDNLLAGLNNWAVELSHQRQYAPALDVLRDGLAIAPTHDLFQKNYVSICVEWAEEFDRAGDVRQALAVLEEALTYHPGEPRLLEARQKLIHTEEERGAISQGGTEAHRAPRPSSRAI